MRDRRLADRYARALLSTLDDSDAEKADRFLTAMQAAVRESRELRILMNDPSVPRSRRKAALGALAAHFELPTKVVNFLNTLADNKRTAALPSIADRFRHAREEAMGIVSAEIRTPLPMNDDLREQARASLEKLTGRTVRLDCTLDADLIGGAVTQIGSTVYDGSLRTQLQRLRRKMTQE
jgi:F-type H+-transporting ATPase subunit delta